MLDVEQIRDVLPHRYPFLLVDRITELVPEKSARGYKNVTINEEFFEGHFPGHAVMPGVLVCEAMAQVGGVLLLSMTGNQGKLAYFGGMDKVRFRKPIHPGDTFVTDVELLATRGNIGKVSAVARVDGDVVAEGEFMFALVDRDGNSARSESRQSPLTGISVHPTAIVDSTAELCDGVVIGPFCVIGKNSKLGKGTKLDSHVVIDQNTFVGENCAIGVGAALGGAPQDHKFKGEKSFLKIGDSNIIREYVTIHRASGEGESTVIGDNNMLMAYCHVGHNCRLGNNITMANMVGISGHTQVEDRVVFGGIVGVHQNVRIGKFAMVGGFSKLVQDVPPFTMTDGRPAKVCDLNVIGLRRNGVGPKERAEVRKCYKLLYRSNLNVSQALEAIEREVERNPEVDYLIEFIRNMREGYGGRQMEVPRN